MVEIYHDYRDFKKGNLVQLARGHKKRFGHDKRLSPLGIVTGFNNMGWIKITWSNGVEGAWPYYKIKLVENTQGKRNV